MAFKITKALVIICEGQADCVFLRKLLEKAGLQEFDVPDHKDLENKHGWAAIGSNIRALAGDPSSFRKLKGILVVADSGDDLNVRFGEICDKIATDGPFEVPHSFNRPPLPNAVAPQAQGPAIAVMMLPLDRPGALETVCGEAILEKMAWLGACVDAYLGCGEIKALEWGAEKRDKARLQCMIAALHKDDPNKGLGHLLHVTPPVIDLEAHALQPIVRQIEQFRDAVFAI